MLWAPLFTLSALLLLWLLFTLMLWTPTRLRGCLHVRCTEWPTQMSSALLFTLSTLMLSALLFTLFVYTDVVGAAVYTVYLHRYCSH
jgi:hypothetical protein